MTNTLLTNPTKTPAHARAVRALGAPRMIFVRVKRHYEQAMHAIWGAPDPAAVITAAGTQGAELLTRLDAAKAYLEGQQAGSSTAVATAVKPRAWTAKADGGVTLAAK
jgi:hypothetical protein